MPNRILRDSIRSSESLSMLSAEEERHFYRLLVYADDYGRFDARPVVILGACYPLLMDSINPQDVARWTDRLADAEIGILELYSENGRTYGAFRNWDKHQRIRNAKSKYPAPPSFDSNWQQLPPHVRPDVVENGVGDVVENGVGDESECENGVAAEAAPDGASHTHSKSNQQNGVSENFREAMRREFGTALGDSVDARIDLALSHESVLKFAAGRGRERRVHAWLKADAENAHAPARAGPNGRVSPRDPPSGYQPPSPQEREAQRRLLEERREQQRQAEQEFEQIRRHGRSIISITRGQEYDTAGERESVQPGDG